MPDPARPEGVGEPLSRLRFRPLTLGGTTPAQPASSCRHTRPNYGEENLPSDRHLAYHRARVTAWRGGAQYLRRDPRPPQFAGPQAGASTATIRPAFRASPESPRRCGPRGGGLFRPDHPSRAGTSTATTTRHVPALRAPRPIPWTATGPAAPPDDRGGDRRGDRRPRPDRRAPDGRRGSTASSCQAGARPPAAGVPESPATNHRHRRLGGQRGRTGLRFALETLVRRCAGRSGRRRPWACGSARRNGCRGRPRSRRDDGNRPRLAG